MTCGKAQEFLERNKVKPGETVDAKKTPMPRPAALSLIPKVEQLYVSKGTKVVHVDLKKDKLSADQLADLLLGPTGNLRAPTMIRGKTLVVGFNPETYQKVLGSK